MKVKKALILNGSLYIPHHDAYWVRGATCATFCDLYNKEKQRCRKLAICDGAWGRYYKCKGKIKDIVLEGEP